MNKHVSIIFILLSTLFIATGFCDLDAQFVSVRFQEYWRSVDFWEFCPFLRVNWWLAYQISLLRIVAGCLLLGWCLSELRKNN